MEKEVTIYTIIIIIDIDSEHSCMLMRVKTHVLKTENTENACLDANISVFHVKRFEIRKKTSKHLEKRTLFKMLLNAGQWLLPLV